MRPCHGLVLRLALAGVLAPLPVEAADLETPVGYAEWAEAAIASPPSDVRRPEDLEQQLVELTNQRRTQQGGLPRLQTDPGLERAARAHALDMLARDYMGHVGPNGRDVGDRVAILDRRFIGGTGENLAEHVGLGLDQLTDQAGPLAVRMVDGWMASPGHRRNLLDPDYTHQGLAAAGQGERVVIVQVFGRRTARLAEPLPLEVEQGARLPLELAAGNAGPAPQQFAFAPPDKAAEELVTLDLSSNQVVVDPGQYRLKFFIPSERAGYFEIADGPLVVVR